MPGNSKRFGSFSLADIIITLSCSLLLAVLLVSSHKGREASQNLLSSIDKLTSQVTEARDLAASALSQNATLQAKNDSLRTMIDSVKDSAAVYKALYASRKLALPQIVPAACTPFSEALSACDRALREDSVVIANQDSSIKVFQEQVKVTTSALSSIRDTLNAARDTIFAARVAAKDLTCTYDLVIVEVGCISRTGALILGAAAGAGGVLWLSR